MVDAGSLNPFGNFDIGVGAIGNALILFVIVMVIFCLIGWLVYWRITSKQYNKKIPLYKSINGVNYKQATYFAKVVPISKAGDCLWYVKGLRKYISPATKTSALNEYPHEEREDGEWINFEITTVNEEQKKAGVKFIQQDMRANRVATGMILEQRLVNKGFWEKYKDMIVHLVFYLIVMVCLIVIFWQWSDITDKVGGLVGQLVDAKLKFSEFECIGRKETGIVPALLPFLFFWRREK